MLDGVSIVIGKPGSGKSLFSVQTALDHLLDPTESRPIITNLPFWTSHPEGPDGKGPWRTKDGRVAMTPARFLWSRHQWPRVEGEDPEALTDEDLARLPGGWGQRVWQIGNDHAPLFFRYRLDAKGNRWIAPMVPDPHAKKDGETIADFKECPGGAVFLIDEVHRFYPARRWQVNGLQLLTWIAEHRHLSDAGLLLTNSPGQLDKQCKEALDSWIVLRDRRKQTWKGFRVANDLEFGRFEFQPTRSDKPLSSGSLKVRPKEICAIYDTAAGPGASGGSGGDAHRDKLRGLDWRWIAVPVAAAMVGLYFLPKAITAGFRQVAGAAGVGLKSAVGLPVEATNAPAAAAQPQTPPTQVPRSENRPERQEPTTAELYLTGFCPMPPTWRTATMWSDGRILLPGRDPEITAVNPHLKTATREGKEYRMGTMTEAQARHANTPAPSNYQIDEIPRPD